MALLQHMSQRFIRITTGLALLGNILSPLQSSEVGDGGDVEPDEVDILSSSYKGSALPDPRRRSLCLRTTSQWSAVEASVKNSCPILARRCRAVGDVSS